MAGKTPAGVLQTSTCSPDGDVGEVGSSSFLYHEVEGLLVLVRATHARVLEVVVILCFLEVAALVDGLAPGQAKGGPGLRRRCLVTGSVPLALVRSLISRYHHWQLELD